MTPDEAIAQVRNSPAAWARVFLDMAPDSVQLPLLDSIATKPRVAIRTANGTGKTWCMALTVLWWLTTRRPSIAITTASTWRQVSKQLWAEINKLYRIADKRARIVDFGTGQRATGLGADITQTEIKFAPDHFGIGFSTDDPGLFEGFHSEHVLVIVDEAKAVPQSIVDACERLLSTGVETKLVIASTPGGSVGPFYDCFTRRATTFATHHVSGWYSTRVSQDWCAERKREWGEDNPLYLSAVCGEFATLSEDALISLQWVDEAQRREATGEGEKRLGVDIARFGDDETVAAVLLGDAVQSLKMWQGQDLMRTVGEIIRLMQEHGIPAENVNVDDSGLGGGVTDRLREQNHRINPVNNGGKALADDRFANVAGESWWGLREALRQGQLTLPDDDVLKAQLVGRKYTVRSDGKILLETKDQMKKRGLKSPDRADAVVLACYRPRGMIATATVAVSGPRRQSPVTVGARKI